MGAPGASLLQRAELLERMYADLHGPRLLLRRGLLPAPLVLGHPGFLRECAGIRLPGSHQLPIVSTDVVRHAGAWCALGDRTQAPSGAGYALENRRVTSAVLPGLHRGTAPARLRPFFHTLRAALQDLAPAAARAARAPRVVILSPGDGSETAFDQAFLSVLLGFPLVQGQDLTVRDGRVWLRSLGRPEPVDVVLRRVDGWFCDPLRLRADSRLGVPGLLQAARTGTVSVVNPPGAGVLENPGLLAHLPRLCRELLGEPVFRYEVIADHDRVEPAHLPMPFSNPVPFGRSTSSTRTIGSARALREATSSWAWSPCCSMRRRIRPAWAGEHRAASASECLRQVAIPRAAACNGSLSALARSRLSAAMYPCICATAAGTSAWCWVRSSATPGLTAPVRNPAA